MKHKPMIAIMVCFVVVITGAIITTKTTEPMEKIVISADYPKYDTLENLVNRADTIVKGKIIDFKYSELNITQEVNTDDEYLNPGGEMDDSTTPYTIYMIEIEKAYKGKYTENDVIEVKQLGGISGNVEYILEESIDPKLEKEHNYVFFLETYSDSPASLLNPLQASYEYDENDNIINRVHGKSNEQNKINFTMQELDDFIMNKQENSKKTLKNLHNFLNNLFLLFYKK